MELPALSRHWAARVLAALGLAGVFVAAAVAGVILHSDLPVSRRLAARFVQEALTGVLGGKVVSAPLGQVTPTHVTVPSIALYDAYAHRVLTLDGVRVDLSLRALVHDLLLGSSTGAVVVSHVQVTSATVALLPDPKTGEPTLVHAVLPPRAPSTGGAGGSVGVFLPSIEVGTAVVHVETPPLPTFDAHLGGVRGRVRAGPRGITVDVNRFGLALLGKELRAHGTGTYALRVPGPMQASFEGFLGDAEMRASATLDGTRLDVTADVLRANPAAMREWVPGWPLTVPVTGHAEARGDLPNLATRVRVDAGPATLSVEGPVVAGSGARATLTLHARHVDARAFDAGAPVTDLGADGRVAAHMDGSELTADVSVTTQAAVIDGNLVPAVDLQARIAGKRATGTLEVHEPGLPVSASFALGPGLVLDLDARTPDVSVARIERLSDSGVSGHGAARGHAHLENGALRANVDADLGGLRTRGVELGRAHVRAELTGSLADLARLRTTGRIEASSARVSGFDLDRATVDVRGTTRAFDFDADVAASFGPSIHAKGIASLSPRPVLGRTVVLVEQGPVHMEGNIAELDVERGAATIENLRITGAGGAITGSLRLAERVFEVELKGENVDVEALARALGRPRGETSGTLRIDTDLVIGPDVTRGDLRLGLGNGSIGAVGGLSLQLDAHLDGHHVTGDASGLVAGLGTFGTTWDTELDGTPLEASSWRRATGRAEVQVGDVELAVLGALLPKDAPVGGVRGRAYGRALLERKSAEAPLPSAFVTVSTRGLALVVRPSADVAAVRIEGTDLTATGQFDGASGESTGTTLAADAHGDLFTATGAVRIDVPRLVNDPARALAQLFETPIDMVVSVPAHKIADLPELVRPEGVAGTVSALASLRGSLSKPTLFVGLNGQKLERTSAQTSRPVDVHAEGQYEWATRNVSARAAASVVGREAATVLVTGRLPGGLDTFRGSARADLNQLPLDVLGVGADGSMTGKLVGNAAFVRNDAGGSLGADLRLVEASVEHTSLGDGEIRLQTTGSTATAEVSFRATRGSLDATLSAPLAWKGVLPTAGDSAPIRAHVVAREFAAAAIAPAVTGVLSRIGGRLDAELSLEMNPVSNQGELAWTGGVAGTAKLTGGTLLVDALGLPVTDLSANMTATGKGTTTTLAIRDISGRVRSAKSNLHGSADLLIDGVRVTGGSATLDANDMPFLFRGAPQARITGRAEAKLRREDGRMQVDIALPRIVAALPQASARQVQDLGENQDITVAQFEREGPENHVALPWRLTFELGREVTLRRADVDLSLTGSPSLDLGDEVVASGTIELVPGGRIPVLGKVFTVDGGTVSFDTGDPANPHVNLRATWHGETLVYVEVTGTLRDAQIALRSNPPLPEAEVFALLLGGSTSDTGAPTGPAQANGAGASAVAFSSAASALGLNQLIVNNPVEIRVDSTAQSQPRYTAAVRIRENLWFEASEYAQSDYGTGTTDRNVVSGTVDYRFARKWSLRTEVGTAGGALDLLWQYRY
jgi:autotransporter translocation and assembly factor TamB